MPRLDVNGCGLFYADDDFVEPWRPHDAVFLQPNLFGDHTQFATWVPTLSRDFRVIRMDRRGSGESDKPGLDYVYSLAAHVADVVAFLDAAGLDRVHYIGESFGGVLGIALAAKHPERLLSLVLCATPGRLPPGRGPADIGRGFADGPTAVLALGSYAYMMGQEPSGVYGLGAPEQRQAWLYRQQRQARTPAHVLAGFMRMTARPDFDVFPLLQDIRTPTLLLSPGASLPCPRESQIEMRSAIAGCEEIVFEGANHGLAWEQPDACARASRDFIVRHARTPLA